MNTVTMTASREVNSVCGVKNCVLPEPHTTEDDEHVAFEVRRGEPGEGYYLVRVWRYVVPDPAEPHGHDWKVSAHVQDFTGAPDDFDRLLMALFAARSTCEQVNREAVA